MALIFPQVPIIFTMSIFEYSPIKWKCRGRSPTAWFTQNGWAGVVDSTADFLNSAELSPFVRVAEKNGFLTKSLLTKHILGGQTTKMWNLMVINSIFVPTTAI